MLHLTTKRTVRTVIILLILTFILASPVSAALNTTKLGGMGLDPQLNGDRHNSYSWCLGILHHTDGDYIYVGSNRDMAYLVVYGLFRTIKNTTDLATINGYIETFFGGDIGTYPTAADVDLHPRIFRLKLNATNVSWELIYTSPNVPKTQVPLEYGYRGMQVFTDSAGKTALYIVTASGGTNVTRVLRILGDTDPQSIAIEEVYRVSGTTSLRPIAVHVGKLYIGANNNIFELSDIEANSWTQIAADSDFGGIIAEGKKAMLWQFISFNNYLYVSLYEDVDTKIPQTADNGGAWLFKGRYDANLSHWVWTPIIADQSKFPNAPYPKGMGNRFNTTFSFASFKNYLYVGTLMTFAPLLSNPSFLMENRIPPQIYRFSKTDVGEMVIGDTTGTTKSTIFTSRIGNYGAGFFQPSVLQTLSIDSTIRDANFSLNQYLWWLAEYNGKLYAGTFDIRVFMKYMTRANLEFLGIIATGDDDAWQTAQTLLQAVDTYNDNPAGCDVYYTSDGINWSPLTRDGFGDEFNYGARIFLPTADMLYIGTANPFYGAQVYALKDTDSATAASDSSAVGGCFIATAAFGSYLDPHVNILRVFRDRFLLTNAPGKAFVSFYYKYSTPIARFLERHEVFKPFVRIALLPIIGICYLFINGFGSLVFIIFALIPIALLIIYRNRRRNQTVLQEELQN
ncbi:MAG: hypothetical protein NTW65_07365 [Deltaproteobacteria bacterium]|nr:hypothetical protein [Deltaproteobacteria bacterium]